MLILHGPSSSYCRGLGYLTGATKELMQFLVLISKLCNFFLVRLVSLKVSKNQKISKNIPPAPKKTKRPQKSQKIQNPKKS